jgi:hypothetical protein
MDPVALRLQELDLRRQVLVLARLAEERSESGRVAPGEIDALFDDIGLPRPKRVSDVLASLEREGLVSRMKGRGAVWRLTPKGGAKNESLFTEIDLAALLSDAVAAGAPYLGSALHPVIPPSLAPPELIHGLHRFLAEHPFDRNVFGMTRFPEEADIERDPVTPTLDVARRVCASHRLEFHLASDRSISDDLWTNVAGHMWASRYGVAFFEDRLGRGVNYNLTIEVGAMIMTGRRCALLKDSSIERLPTDLVGRIYKEINLEDLKRVEGAVHAWIRDDLGLGPCETCR